jgi:hypothetical protein
VFGIGYLKTSSKSTLILSAASLLLPSFPHRLIPDRVPKRASRMATRVRAHSGVAFDSPSAELYSLGAQISSGLKVSTATASDLEHRIEFSPSSRRCSMQSVDVTIIPKDICYPNLYVICMSRRCLPVCRSFTPS